MALSPANDDKAPTQKGRERFDYSAPAEIFMVHAHRRSNNYRRFRTAAEAVRFAVEEVPPRMLVGAVMEVREARFDHKAIRELYTRDTYPLARAQSGD